MSRGSANGSHLKYSYRNKTANKSDGSPNREGSCATFNIRVRPTTPHDLVSFEVSGSLDGGNALFGDPNTYGGDFGFGRTPSRGYLLVSNSDAAGNRVDVGSLSGEFVNLDIGAGAAWGGRAVNDSSQDDYDFVHADAGGGVHSSMGTPGGRLRALSFFPPNQLGDPI